MVTLRSEFRSNETLVLHRMAPYYRIAAHTEHNHLTILLPRLITVPSHAKRDNLKGFEDFFLKHGSSPGQNLALTGAFVPSSLDSGWGAIRNPKHDRAGEPRPYNTAPPWDSTVGPCLGPYGGPREGGVSYERGTPCRKHGCVASRDCPIPVPLDRDGATGPVEETTPHETETQHADFCSYFSSSSSPCSSCCFVSAPERLLESRGLQELLESKDTHAPGPYGSSMPRSIGPS